VKILQCTNRGVFLALLANNYHNTCGTGGIDTVDSGGTPAAHQADVLSRNPVRNTDQAMGEREWYYVKDGQQHGPIPESTLIELFRNGELGPETQLWTQQLKDWCKASEIDWLLSTTRPQLLTTPSVLSPPRPTSVTVFGVLNIVFGTLGLFSMPCMMLFTLAMPPSIMNPTRTVKAWLLLSYLIGFACTILLIIVGIGLLRQKAWARKWTVGYAWFAIIWGVIGIIINIVLMTSGAYGYSHDATPGAIGGAIAGLIGLVYPVLLVVFMHRPNVKNACAR
jgi:hypothetical protein